MAHSPTMDEIESERMLYRTPLLTPHISDSSTLDYFDLECSFSQKEYQQRMLNLTNGLQKFAELSYHSSDSANESDIQDQQPTEATDDSINSCQRQAKTVNNINESFDSGENQTNTISIVQPDNPLEESYSSVTSDTQTILVEEHHQRPVLHYSHSRCVPYNDDDDDSGDISTNKDSLTNTSEISLDFTEIVEKDKNNLGHIMISYDQSTRALCMKISKYLKNRTYLVWIDRDNITGDVLTSIATAVENSFVVLMAINEEYFQNQYCRLEAQYAVERNIASIPMLMQPGYRSQGWLGIINGAKLHIDFSQLPFDEAFHLLVREIEAIRVSLGADKSSSANAMNIDHQISTTTMHSLWSYSHNVHDWSANDVIEWLNREKLEVFQQTLSYFTGATLWQLYKIKIDSPTDYYRMVEVLISPTIPHRLFHILTFNAALENLFSTSPSSLHQ
ncbi:unnamed protein product [Adineta ricciae]|uniref:TIR domain-containing protein n=1 Tax=Adineta ricciae TaxID=249248 RepID=A0A814NTF7_ADIRI|nr:unnamed protein product [Adineta ricciae]